MSLIGLQYGNKVYNSRQIDIGMSNIKAASSVIIPTKDVSAFRAS